MSITFNLGDVLSVSTGIVFSVRGIDGVSDIIRHMSGCVINNDNVPYVWAECRYYLIRQYPILDSEYMNQELVSLYRAISRVRIKITRERMLSDFLQKKELLIGDSFDVKSISAHLFEQEKNPNAFERMMRGLTG